jgi:UDP-N-acetylmuramoyl-tripeptide--D-alanyl-D-alanine ligase
LYTVGIVKTIAKNIIVSILGWQLRRLKSKNNFKVVAVAGSIGKTSTKLAIASVLKGGLRVQHQVGNYNDIVTVPLIFFGHKTPSLFNPFAWLGVFWKNEKILNKTYVYDVVVVELGTDGPGQLANFKKYLSVDIGVLTAIVPEHMQFFDDVQAVADEELEISKFSSELLINKDLTPPKYLKDVEKPQTYYGISQSSDYQLANPEFSGEFCSFDIQYQQKQLLSAKHELVSEPQLYSVLAAVAVADKLGLSTTQIKEGLSKIRPVSGRMQRLEGINGSIIIDDTYNASPDATKAALDTLYRIKADHKIAVLGNMNELGEYSEGAHVQIGQHCDPKRLDLVITIGPDANKFLAEAAEKAGCKVQSFDSPYTAGEYLKPIIKSGTVILVKGSQNKVFAEETVKQILADKKDQSKLVRQSDDWLRIKHKAFNV